MTKRVLGAALCTSALLCLGPIAVGAQSLTTASLIGSVRDTAGRPLDGAIVTVTDSATGATRTLTTLRTGRFGWPVLVPGVYSILVERLGYRPVRLHSIGLPPGRAARLDVVLSPVPPPVRQIIERRDDRAMLEESRVGLSQGFSRLALAELPDARHDITDLGRLAYSSTPDLESEGLGARLGGFEVPGIPFLPARHPSLPTGDGTAGVVMPSSALEWAELVMADGDVEWSELAGARLSGSLRRGTARGQVRVFGEGSSDALSSSKHFDTGAAGHQSRRIGVLAAGPIVRDTAHFAVGIEYQRRETPWPGGWTADSLTARLLAVARDSTGVDLGPYAAPRVSAVETGAAFGRVDLVLGGTAVTAHAAGTKTFADDADLGPRPTAPLGAKIDGLDFSGGLTVTSAVSPAWVPELRIGFSSSVREYSQGGVVAPATTLVEEGVAFGGDPALPGRIERRTARASFSVAFRTGRNQLKLGGSALGEWYDELYGYGRAGEYFFGDTITMVGGRGSFTQTVGVLPVADFSRSQFAVFFQDRWLAIPGLEVSVGGRVEFEDLPIDRVRRNDRWLELTGLDNTAVDGSRVKVSPRIGLRWELGGGRWLVQGLLGTFHSPVEPAVLGEWRSHTGAVTVRRGVTSIAGWPGVPDSVAAPVQGPWLTLLEPDITGPRTTRVSLGVSSRLQPGRVLHLSGVYRHTDGLPRRQDLNLPVAPVTTDQYGRPVYGTLTQLGGVLAADPGSNRRFPEFDLVAALNPDGFSNYWGATAALEQELGAGFALLGSYTWSRTKDNWLSGRGGFGGPDVELTPFPDSLGGLDWNEGRSDYDVPHRAVVGLEFRASGPAAFRAAALYRFQSGYPFTPGFRDGVDANGDGSARNDPAFVDDGIAGVDALLNAWDCLRGQVGEFAERNSCREPGVHTLDVRLAATLARPGGSPIDVYLDAINLLESDVGIRDRALYLVDPADTITLGPTGQISVPLIANPNFGKLLVRRTNGRFLRIGVRVNY